MNNGNSKILAVAFAVILVVMLAIPSFSQRTSEGWITIYDKQDNKLPPNVSCTMSIRERMYGVPLPAIRKYAAHGCAAMDTQVGLVGLFIDGGIAFGIATLITIALQRKKSSTS
jgi:hypothetical protein